MKIKLHELADCMSNKNGGEVLGKQFYLKGTKAQIDRDIEIRKLLLFHFAKDPRFVAGARKLFRDTGFFDLHLAACNEKPFGGQAFLRYREAWISSTARSELIQKLVIFVRDVLKLPFPWLVADLGRLIFVDMEGKLPSGQVTLQEYGLNAREVPGRYQRFDLETLTRHVEWYYRNKIKSPRDGFRTLASEYPRERTSIRDAVKAIQRIVTNINQIE